MVSLFIMFSGLVVVIISVIPPENPEVAAAMPLLPGKNAEILLLP
jgi:hypothetical protein